MNTFRTEERSRLLRWRLPDDPRRRRALMSLFLFLLLSPAQGAPIVEVRAHAEGLSACCIDRGWEVEFKALVSAGGTYSSAGISEGGGARVPDQVRRSLDNLHTIHTPFLGAWWSLIFLVGMALSLRRRNGAAFGAVTAGLGLVVVLAATGHGGVEAQTHAVRTFPLAVDVHSTPFVGAAIAAWSVMLAWFLFRGALDRRDDQEPRPLRDEDLPEGRSRQSRGHGLALAGAAVGAAILGGAFFLAALLFAEDCAALLRELGEEAYVNTECERNRFVFLGFWTLCGSYGGAVLGCGIGLRLARQPLPVITALFSAVVLALAGYVALGMTVTIALPLALVLFPAAVLISVRMARALALRIDVPEDRDFA